MAWGIISLEKETSQPSTITDQVIKRSNTKENIKLLKEFKSISMLSVFDTNRKLIRIYNESIFEAK